MYDSSQQEADIVTPEEHLQHHDDILKTLTALIVKTDERITVMETYIGIVTELLQRQTPPGPNGR